MVGPAWRRTLLIWTYDEHGGYYGHVPPPPALAPDDIPPEVPAGESAYNGFAQYGFRVPMAVISPWSRPGYVSHGSTATPASVRWSRPSGTCRR